MQSASSQPVDKESEESQLQRVASLYQEHTKAAAALPDEYVPHYYDVNWYLKRLDSIANSAEQAQKHPAAVSAIRTMAELVGLIGPAVNANIDARTQILQLPEGISEAALIALATGSYDEPSVNE